MSDTNLFNIYDFRFFLFEKCNLDYSNSGNFKNANVK